MGAANSTFLGVGLVFVTVALVGANLWREEMGT